MGTESARAEAVGSAIEAWAHRMGVWEHAPVAAATAQASAALRGGASVDQACGIACRYLASWLDHPSNALRRMPLSA